MTAMSAACGGPFKAGSKPGSVWEEEEKQGKRLGDGWCAVPRGHPPCCLVHLLMWVGKAGGKIGTYLDSSRVGIGTGTIALKQRYKKMRPCEVEKEGPH